ncbi:sensor histidine kinase [Capillimicrobium parvum]|uniref:sensor histidine kinase n=1 Tax=Capillimicrobium parvum TaxID=2884022 RepID=UPI00216B5901|nr:PAS domain-containing sensor histidine kinase [Capillimicrobium parvum]
MHAPDSDASLVAGDWRAWQFALLVETVSDYAIFLLEPDGRVASWNRGARRIKGYEAPEVIGRHFSLFYTDADRTRDHPAHELEIAELEGRYEEEGWRVRKDGSRFWANVVITALRDSGGTLVGYGKVTRDLTARRLSEEQLRATAAELLTANRGLDQFRRLVAGVRDYAIFMLDPGGHVASWNAGAEHIKGYTEDEIVGRHFSVFYTEPDLMRDHPAHELEVAARDGRYEEEGWRVRQDGSRFWANVVITPIRNDTGVLIGYAKVTRDLTERRQVEQALRDAHEQLRRSNEELDRFAVVAAHDLSAPLATVTGLAGLLERELPEDVTPKAIEYLRHMSVSTARMAELIDRLLTYARAGEGPSSRRPVDVSEAAGSAIGDLAAVIAERGAEVRVELDGVPSVTAARGDLELVLRNLVGNAVKFGARERPHVRLAWQPEGDGCVRITVDDDGEGIAPDDQVRIFRAFERVPTVAGPRGSGLGLAICARIVQRSGGAIGVESGEGAGSRFWLTLPTFPGDRAGAPGA